VKYQVHHVTVDGQPMVALPAPDYEALLAMRRQLGGLNRRMQIQRAALLQLVELAETLLAAADDDDGTDAGGTAAPDSGPAVPRPGPALLADLQRIVRHSRIITRTRRAPRQGGPDAAEDPGS
jgi:hypothetical protein